MGQNCNKSPQRYSKVTIKLTVTNNNRRFVNFFVLFVIYGQNTMDNYVMMNAPREVSKQLSLAARPSPLVIGCYF